LVEPQPDIGHAAQTLVNQVHAVIRRKAEAASAVAAQYFGVASIADPQVHSDHKDLNAAAAAVIRG
jgi:hypothetical protein